MYDESGPPAPTLRDLASALGISTSTVSRALNNHPYVKEALRGRIQQAAREAGYRPDPLARGLKTQRTYRVGLVIPDILNDFYAAAAAAIERELSAAGYRLQLIISNDDPTLEAAAVDDLRHERADGMIYVPSERRSAAAARLVMRGVPVVELVRRSAEQGVDSVLADERTGAAAATRHLLDLGHRRIAFICGPSTLSTGRERLAGYHQELAAAGISEDPALRRIGPYRRAFGYEALQALLDSTPPPTAVVAASNELLIGVLRAVYERRLTVPDELSIVGFGDPDWFGVAHPPITTVALPIAAMAAAAAQQIIRRLAGRAASRSSEVAAQPVHQQFATTLLVRDSTGAARTKEPPG